MSITARRTALILVLLIAPVSDGAIVSACGGRIAVPKGWTLVVNPAAGIEPLAHTDDVCAFGLRPAKWPPAGTTIDVGQFAVEVHLRREPFESAARHAFFARVGDLRKKWNDPGLEPALKSTDWLVLGRQSSRSPARVIRTKFWKGVVGESEVGYFGGKEGYQGLGPAERAAITDGKLTALFLADNPYTRKEFESILRSFRFPARR